jgi:hypothetical protein
MPQKEGEVAATSKGNTQARERKGGVTEISRRKLGTETQLAATLMLERR